MHDLFKYSYVFEVRKIDLDLKTALTRKIICLATPTTHSLKLNVIVSQNAFSFGRETMVGAERRGREERGDQNTLTFSVCFCLSPSVPIRLCQSFRVSVCVCLVESILIVADRLAMLERHDMQMILILCIFCYKK